MPANLNRRGFLKVLGAAAAAGAAAGLAKVKPALAAPVPGGEMGLVIDLTRCDACGGAGVPACVSACKRENASRFPEPEGGIPENWPQRSAEDWRPRREWTTTLTPYNWSFVQKARVEHEGTTHDLSIPRHCMHCDNPTCASLCPFGAIEKKESGAVCIDSETCLGGAKCRSVCPWGIPQRQSGVGLYLDLAPGYAGGGVMFKCDMCAGRLEHGQAPACVEACRAAKGEKAALSFGPREEMKALARRRAEEIGGFVYGDTQNGGTGTFYVSPVPFEKVDKALHAKKGERFFFPADPEPMKDPNTLAFAALLAPVAAVASAGVASAGTVRKTLRASSSLPERTQEEGTIIRHSWITVLEHWTIALSGLVLLFTGVGQMPMYKRYMVDTLPGLGWSSDFFITLKLHILAGAAFTFAVMFHLVYHGLAGHRSALPRRGDAGESVRIAWATLRGREEPPSGKFLAEQRLAYALIGGTALLLAGTGMVKLLKNLGAVDLPYGLLWATTLLHNLGTGLFLFGFLAHMGAFLLKANRPLFTTMFTRRVGLAYAERRHPHWVAEIRGKEGAEPASPSAPVSRRR